MKARKIIIAAAAVVLVFSAVIATLLIGHNDDADTKKSVVIDTSKPVVIDVSVSDSDVESKAELTWTELGKLTTYEEMRTAVDTAFGNDIVDGIKYGPFYLDKEGNQCTNNTLSVVLGNQFVAEEFKNNAVGNVQAALEAVYTDLSDSDYTPALFNAYFNLLPDSTPNYFNCGDTLCRAEAMALVTRATTPVTTLTVSDDFTSAVTGTDYDRYINYAAQQNEHSYINTNDKSLTADNFKGAMSRAEFVYLVMNEVYGADAVQGFDTSKSALKDCTNAGDLSAELKIAGSDRCNGYTLKYSLDNVDKGVTEELYKALVMAVEKDIITPETRWNEGITKSEAIEIIVNAFSAYYDEKGYLINNSEKGSTTAFTAQAQALWEKQDKNDMSCKEEEFTADYIKSLSDGMTAEEFEASIEERYSIKFAEELAKKEQEEKLKSNIKALWKKLQDQLTCDESTFTEEYKSQLDAQGDSFTEDSFTEYILDKYGIPKETTPPKENNGGSSNNGGNSGNNGGGTSGGNDTPVYTPPADNGGGSGDNGNIDDFPVMVDGEEDIDLDDIHLGGTDDNGGSFIDNGTTGNGSGNSGNGGGTVDIPPGFVWDDDAVVDVVE